MLPAPNEAEHLRHIRARRVATRGRRSRLGDHPRGLRERLARERPGEPAGGQGPVRDQLRRLPHARQGGHRRRHRSQPRRAARSAERQRPGSRDDQAPCPSAINNGVAGRMPKGCSAASRPKRWRPSSPRSPDRALALPSNCGIRFGRNSPEIALLAGQRETRGVLAQPIAWPGTPRERSSFESRTAVPGQAGALRSGDGLWVGSGPRHHAASRAPPMPRESQARRAPADGDDPQPLSRGGSEPGAQGRKRQRGGGRGVSRSSSRSIGPSSRRCARRCAPSEINKVKPDIVGLQEAAWWRTGPYDLSAVTVGPEGDADRPAGGDFLTDLLTQLNKGSKRARRAVPPRRRRRASRCSTGSPSSSRSSTSSCRSTKVLADSESAPLSATTSA